MLKRAARLSSCAAVLATAMFAQQGPVPKGVPYLNHVFVIMMENHGYSQIIGNPDAQFINEYAIRANLATNYFAIGHPSLTNYLEVVGGSNFGVRDDNSPDWHSTTCTPNLASGTPSLEGAAAAICPIQGTGTDADTPAIDYTNETTGKPGAIDIDGKKGVPASSHILGMTIADQLRTVGLAWKTYQESLPLDGADKVNNADGYFSNLTDFATALPGEKQTSANLVALYAVKHNPFAYFANIQEGAGDPKSSLKNVGSFAGQNGLFEDLRRGTIATFSFIAPNQCNDMHGRGNAGPACEYDPSSTGTQAGLNPGLIRAGDETVRNLVGAIHESKVWQEGHNAIVVLWDENDYSIAPIDNRVPLIVETNFGKGGFRTSEYFDHFSLLKSLEAAFGLPCLNHACDAGVSTINLFNDK